ncbi:hypothetical protein DB32_002193 [Sandaracinus amylolyticus]|uniref:Uncharacterized protein n=1 Tax=Sandaracinus amylolyticus TaxID=927083 RepID=A0A0F6SEE3_9BACT|nr:hypothetical protein DB32_002193 [Sandaracinus amylolyticus]
MRWGREIHATLRAHIAHDDLLSDAQRAALDAESARLGATLTTLETATAAYGRWLSGAHVESRASLRVANYVADEAQRAVDATLRPHRDTLARFLPGGWSTLFGDLSLSRVLRAGHARTAKLAADGASMLRSLPSSVPGAGALPPVSALADRLDTAATRIRGLLDHVEREVEPQRRPLKSAVERGVFDLREGLEQMDARLRATFPASFIESLYPELTRGGTAIADEPDEDDDDTDPPAPAPAS